jgi:VWFA-related protein
MVRRANVATRLVMTALLAMSACSYAQEEQGKPTPTPEQKPSEQGKSGATYEFRTTSRLVILDLVATDTDGHTVADLRPEEVRIFENGKEQTKRDFSFLQASPEQAAQRVELHLPPDVFTNVPQYKGNTSFNIILFDVLNTSFPNLAYAHDQLIKYLETTPPNQPTAIYALGNKLWLLHDFTTDYESLKEVMRKFKGQGSKLVLRSPDDEKAYQRKSTFTTAGADHAVATLEAFRSLARIMAGYKGRKNLVWISESFVVDTMPDIRAPRGPMFLDNYSRFVEQTSDAMMDAQIAIYAIDAGALSGETFRPMLSRFSAQSSLREMAERTGGKAFMNRNDLDMGIRNSIDDGSSYYTTSYTPSNKTWDGQLRKIEVKITRPGVKLRYRQGYYAAAQPSAPPATKSENKEASIDLAQALDPDLPVATGLIFQAQVVPPSEKTSNKVLINFALDPHLISFSRTEDGLHHAEVSCIAWAFPVKGKPIGSGGSTIKAAVDAPTFNQLMQGNLPCRQTLDLQPGNYMLRLGVIDQVTRQIGALTAWVTVPGEEPAASAVAKP